MARYKTQEEIEQERLLREERYPELKTSTEDPTAALRSNIMSGASNLLKNSPLYKSLSSNRSPASIENQTENTLPDNYNQLAQEEANEQDAQYELSPEMMDYAYKIFPNLNDIAPRQSQQQIPMAPGEINTPFPPMGESQEAQTQEQTPLKQEAPPSVSGTAPQATPKATPQAIPQAPQMEAQPDLLPAPKEPSIEDMMKQAQEEEDRALLWKQSAKLRDAVMGAGSGTIIQTDTSLYDELQKRAQRPLKNLLLSQELKDKKEKNDPNSEISKLAKKALTDLGMNLSEFKNVSYAQLEKLYPSLTNAISTKIAAQARKEEAQAKKDELSLRKLEKAEARLEKLDEKTKKEASDHIDFAMRQLNKPYSEYEKGRTDLESAKEIVEKVKLGQITPGASDVTLLYTLIRSLDPASTVREGEIQLSKSAMSLWGRIRQGTESVVEGALLDKDTRKSFEEILKGIQIAREKSFSRNKAALVQAGQGKGLNADILENSIYPEFDTKSIRSKKPKEKELTPQERLAKLEEIAIRNQTRMDELNSKKGQ